MATAAEQSGLAPYRKLSPQKRSFWAIRIIKASRSVSTYGAQSACQWNVPDWPRRSGCELLAYTLINSRELCEPKICNQLNGGLRDPNTLDHFQGKYRSLYAVW